MSAGATKRERPPAPGPLRAESAQVHQLFDKDVAAARTDEQRSELLKRIRRMADEEAKPVSQYALYEFLKDTASKWADDETAVAALKEIEARFETDTLSTRAEVLLAALKTATGPRATGLTDRARETGEEAIRADRFDLARRLADLSLASAKRANDPPLVAEATAYVRNTALAEQASKDAAKASAALTRDPNDPQANSVVGRFRCFIQNDWPSGLPLLARGNDATLVALAKLELLNAKEPDELVTLADGWWDVAQKESGWARERVLRRSGDLYRGALPGLKGLSKARVERRVAEIAQLTQTRPPKTFLSDLQETSFDALKWFNKGGALPREVGTRVVVKGSPSAKALFMHAKPPNDSAANVKYDLKGSYNTLSGAVGFDDSSIGRTMGSLVFRVVGDGKELWRSQPLRPTQSESFKVRVSRLRELTLEVHAIDTNMWGHAVWIDPALE
jgi:hypothetical protein